MKKLSWLTLTFILVLLVLFVSTASADLVIDQSYQLISKKRVGRTAYEFTYQVNISNNGSDVQNVTASVSSSSPHTTIVDGDVNFGDVAGGSTVTGADTFSFRQNRRYPFDPSALSWDVQFTEPYSSVIGPEGGVVEVTDPDSPIYGLTIEIPEGALLENKNISVSVIDQPDNEVPYASSLFPQVDFGPDGTVFETPIRITYLVTDEVLQSLGVGSLEEIKEFLNAYYFDEVNNVWNLFRIVEIDSVNNKVTFEMEHFTVCELVLDAYSISKVELIDPVEKGKPFELKLYVESHTLTDVTVRMLAKFGTSSDVTSAVLEFPDDVKEPAIILTAPDLVSFENLTIDGLAIIESEGAKRLWEQRMVVDYDTVVSDFADYNGENLFEKYAPVLQFAEKAEKEKVTDPDVYFPTDIHEAFDIDKELKRCDVIVDSDGNASASDMSMYSSIHHTYDYDGEDIASSDKKIVYATAIDEGDTLYLVYIFYYHHDTKTGLLPNLFASHNADNERIVVILEKTGGDYEPISVVYGQHVGYKRQSEIIVNDDDDSIFWDKGHIILPWNDVINYGNHPYVYVAEGSHACYPRVGTYRVIQNNSNLLFDLVEDAGAKKTSSITWSYGDKWFPCDYDIMIIPRLHEISSDHDYNFLLFSGQFGEGKILTDPKMMTQLGWWLFASDKVNHLVNYDGDGEDGERDLFSIYNI